MAGLCALSDVKTWLEITSTTKDVKLQMFIDNISAQVQIYLGYPTKLTTYTNERHAINNLQYMYLDAANIQTVTAVTIDGLTVTAGTGDDNYQMSPADAIAGRLYRGIGWQGRYFVRGMTYDPVAGARTVLVSYTAGWLFPDDALYSKGTSDSVPPEISAAVMQEVVSKYRKSSMSGEGLTSYREGGESWTWDISKNGNAGLSDDLVGVLNGWKRWAVA